MIELLMRRLNRPSFRTALVCAVPAMLFCGWAHAQQVSSCTVSASGVAFGIYDPTAPGALASSGTVAVSCAVSSGHNAVTIALSPGSSGTFGQRTMLTGTDTLNYNLYLDAAYSQVWGDGTAGTVTDTHFVTHGHPAFSATVYALMPALQTPGAGTFSDTITVTVSF